MSFQFDRSKPIAIGADHAGFEYKTAIVAHLNKLGFQISDFGTYSPDSVDYPDFAHPTATSVENKETAFGILICGSANGVAITANKHKGIRAGLCWQKEVAELTRKHNNANILCIPARFVSLNVAIDIIDTFLNTPFEGGRHQARVNKISC
ncbi:ribose 5-phosphate isomerase B [Segetibacter sp.]|jgi:ribose 5-phosphate isomerase B|uniref:ribose 5-phosphate isomerase B n=1 Tax=Segetibacter sp. TaxID=2231182 RepID=UPI002610C628|nr:ribose 5-phosphate isomerase B [Segetibacter sp.]MCW3081381.1 ribose 5-phosphate isomerase [Segetibacter sp.]